MLIAIWFRNVWTERGKIKEGLKLAIHSIPFLVFRLVTMSWASILLDRPFLYQDSALSKFQVLFPTFRLFKFLILFLTVRCIVHQWRWPMKQNIFPENFQASWLISIFVPHSSEIDCFVSSGQQPMRLMEEIAPENWPQFFSLTLIHQITEHFWIHGHHQNNDGKTYTSSQEKHSVVQIINACILQYRLS